MNYFKWSVKQDLNLRPELWKSSALPTELLTHKRLPHSSFPMSDTCFFKSPFLHCEEAGGIKGGESRQRLAHATFTFPAPDVSIAFLFQSKKLQRDYYPRYERRLNGSAARIWTLIKSLWGYYATVTPPRKFARHVSRLVWLRGQDLNLRSLGYEPSELPLLHPAMRATYRQIGFMRLHLVLYKGFDPSSFGWKPNELATVLIEHDVGFAI